MDFNIGPFRFGFNNQVQAGLRESQVVEEAKVEAPVVENKQINEFSTIVGDFAGVDLKAFTEKYPLISTIAMIALGFFGLIDVLSLFSPINILTGIFFGALSISLGKSLWNIDGVFWKVWENAKFALNAPQKVEVVPVPAAPAPAAVKV